MNTSTGTGAGTDPRALRVIDAWAATPGRAVIFDFNGTLSDDEPILFRLYTEMFRERLQWTLTPRQYFQRLGGRSDREIIDIVVEEIAGGDEKLSRDLLAERRTRYCDLVEHQSPILPATVDMVRRLADHGVPMGIVTGAQRVDVEFVLSRSPLAGAFTAIVTVEDVTRGKPDPEGFELGAQRMGVEPAAVLVFEDSVFGARAARSAGMRCVAVEGTVTRAELEGDADAVVSGLSPDLFAILQQDGRR
ncbi:HAD family phosphatase [Planosporangium thailandense]|uniref:HAD family phosphatase n=1 Tax=Planosporangium thailandense TaxID=765197 RepID=A0ABX0XRQ0_9ACTN|nr:HAD family phosphatase [Planosporangium thailandense]NJC68638.1 HAD family phosphatase [Planosporangium thailandense]